jgi:hypothetical protein
MGEVKTASDRSQDEIIETLGLMMTGTPIEQIKGAADHV